MKLLLPLFVVAACGSSAAQPDAKEVLVDSAPDTPRPDTPVPGIDAPQADLGCLGAAPPTTAPDPLPVGGKVLATDHYHVSAIEGVIVTLHRRSDNTVLGSAMTAMDGTFAMSVVSGGVPVDSYFTTAAPGYPASRVDPGEPLSGGETALLAIAKDDEVARWYADAGQPYAPGAHTLITITVDCAGAPLAGTSIAIQPTEPVAYYDDVASHWNPALATSTNGYALITTAQTPTTVTASWQAVTFPAHVVTAPAGASIAVITPRLY